MQLVYYKHYIEYHGHRYFYDFRSLLKDYIDNAPEELKKNLKTSDENYLFLFNTQNVNIFLFVMVKDNELVKAINTYELSQEDIQKRLLDNEKLGFASYIYANDVFYGLASTFFGPKNGVWLYFLNELIFRKTNNRNVIIQSEAFPTIITRDELQKLKFTSTTRIKINDKHPVFSQFMRLFGCSDDARTVEFTVSPCRNKFLYDNNNQINQLLEIFPKDDGIEKFIVSGKNSLEDTLTEFYLIGNGHISDSIVDKEESSICCRIESKINNNKKLQNELRNLRNEGNYQTELVQDISLPLSSNHWNNSLF